MKQKITRIGLFILILMGIVLALTNKDMLSTDALQNWVSNAGGAAPLVFMLIYILGTVFFLPGSVLTLLGGALFGPVLGTFYNLTAATIGAMLSFLVARFVASDWVAGKSGDG